MVLRRDDSKIIHFVSYLSILAHQWQVEQLSAELTSARDKVVADSSQQPSAKDHSVSAKASEESQPENVELQQKLKTVEEHRNQLQNELQETRLELDGLKQNLEEAERIEVLNEELQEQLQVYKSNAKVKDDKVRNIDFR